MVLVIVVVVGGGADSCSLLWYPVFEYSELILQESPYVERLQVHSSKESKIGTPSRVYYGTEDQKATLINKRGLDLHRSSFFLMILLYLLLLRPMNRREGGRRVAKEK
jgi:hypothetical protein